ncbi:MAG: outer membrane beta-barrel protein, partial [Bacteroidales bacterium]
GIQTRVEQIGDTTQYHADGYKTKSDATGEDLVTKMPGITQTNGTFKFQNENVQQVLVDGKPYFDQDPTLALRSLPADVIDKIQVFNKLSDQAEFTGFDDGNSAITVNIMTRSGKNEGQFGKIYGGYGTDDTWLGGGYVNYFQGDERITLIGITNDVNQQNFSSQDLLGIQSSGGRRGGMGGGMPGGGGPSFGGGGSSYGGSANNFMVNQQSGITTTNSIGLNYTDMWGKKIKATASYFFNNSNNTNDSKMVTDYTLNTNTDESVYNENSDVESKNFNHRLSGRFEYTIDTANSIVFTPKLYFQLNNGSNSANGFYTDTTHQFYNDGSRISGYTTNNNILYRHKFHKKGRTISVNIEADMNEKTGSGTQISGDSLFFPTPARLDSLSDMKSTVSTSGYTVGTSLSYTEPIGTSSQLQINYSPYLTKNVSDSRLYGMDSLKEYSLLDTTFSNKFYDYYITQKTGLSYRYHKNKINFSVGANYQYAILKAYETFPESGTVNRYFNNILPNAMLSFRFSKTSNLRINFRSSTTAPTISQLQDVVNNSNPMMLTIGNPDLKQQNVQTIFGNYSKTTVAKGETFMIWLYASYTNDYIGNSVIHAFKDTIIDDVMLARGAQLSKLVNLDNSWNLRSFFTYGFPLNFMKCNLNLHTGFQYSTIPGLVDRTLNTAQTYAISQGVVLSSNISEKVDFTISYTANYNIAQNSLDESNGNYFSHTATVKLNWIIWKGFFIGGDATNYYYNGLSQSFNENYFLVDPYIGKKLFKNQNGEIKLMAYDLLKQNNSISQTVTASYIENIQTQMLQRYYMIMFTYNIKKYKGSNNKPNLSHT